MAANAERKKRQTATRASRAQTGARASRPHRAAGTAAIPSPSPIFLRDARRDCRLAVACADRSIRLELVLGRQTFLAGQWAFEVQRGGRPATPVSTWTETCRVADRDVDYLELRIDLSGGLCLERHIVLARQDRFLLLADAVLSADFRPSRNKHYSIPARRRTESHSVPAKTQLDYCGTLPLAPDVAWCGAKETREGLLVGQRRALVLPLALPEWRAQNGVGELIATVGGGREIVACNRSTDLAVRNGRSTTASCIADACGLQLRQVTSGRALFAPLFFDLDGRRVNRPATWRQLTIGQKGVVQPGDAAVGYRAAVGSRQWLIYRSLAPAASRTLLGHNLNGETLVARFRRDGEVETIVEVE